MFFSGMFPDVFPGKERFYPILNFDPQRSSASAAIELLTLWRQVGLGYYQLRAKNISPLDYLQLAQELKAGQPRLALIANDHAEMALRHPCLFAGLHLGQEDLAALDASCLNLLKAKMRRPEAFLLGLSTHSREDIQRAFDPADPGIAGQVAWSYLALGPCFPTSSKRGGRAALLRQGGQQEFIGAISAFMTLNMQSGQGRRELALIGGIGSANLKELLTIWTAQAAVAQPPQAQAPLTPVPQAQASLQAPAPLRRVAPVVAAIGAANNLQELRAIIGLLEGYR